MRLATDVDVQALTADPTESVRLLVARMAGQRLPAERTLAEQLRISRPRLRTILAMLQSEGLVEARRGSGTFAVSEQPGALRRVTILIDSRLKLGDDPFFSALVEHLQLSVQRAGARCLVERTDGRRLPHAREDGGITVGLAGAEIIAGQRADDPPLVGLFLGEEVRPSRRVSVFQLADREAGETAARYLIDRGCCQLIFVGRQDIPSSAERLRGVEMAVEVAGNGVRLRFINSPLHYAAGLRLGLEIEIPHDTDRAVGIIATNDWLAVGLRLGLQHRRDDPAAGRCSPIPIVSFDGLPLTADPSLQIVSLAMPLSTIAADAVAELARLHRSGGAGGRTIRYPLDEAATGTGDDDQPVKL